MVVINTSWEKAPWADVLYACDALWWKKYEGVPGFEGLKYTQDDGALVYPTMTYIESVDKPGLSFDRSVIHQGGNSGYQAMNLAFHLGAKRIVLIGYDMKLGAGGAKHWHSTHPTGLNNPDAVSLKRWGPNFAALAADLKRAGVEVINCSLDTALTSFPRARLEDVLQ